MNKTLVIQPLPGIGDMIWHLPYIAGITKNAPAGRVSIMAKRRSMAAQLLKAELFFLGCCGLMMRWQDATGSTGCASWYAR